MTEILNAVEEDLRAKIGSIRHPETGEFPVLVVRGSTLENLHVEVTGSPKLIALVHERLHPDEKKGMNEEIEKPGGVVHSIFKAPPQKVRGTGAITNK